MIRKPAKHVQIMRLLRSRILRGKQRGKLPSFKDLAVELGVNPKTVQLALVQLEGLGLVRRVARQGTFVVSQSDRRRKSSRVYARLVLPLPIPFPGAHPEVWQPLVIYAFQQAAERNQVNMTLEYSQSADDAVAKALVEAGSPQCVGTCVLSIRLDTKQVFRLAEIPGPIVVADWDLEVPLVPTVCFDNVAMGHMVARHLLDLGHRRMVFVAYPTDDPDRQSRLRGIEEFLKKAGADPMQTLIYEGTGAKSITRLIQMDAGPTAIVTADASDARAVIRLAAAVGKRVPEDISIVSLGGGQLTREQGVTGPLVNEELLGARALEALLNSDLQANARRILIPPTFADHHTTAAPRRQ
jgi:DNA-binding LacI/PurR family transcriptional regulator